MHKWQGKEFDGVVLGEGLYSSPFLLEGKLLTFLHFVVYLVLGLCEQKNLLFGFGLVMRNQWLKRLVFCDLLRVFSALEFSPLRGNQEALCEQ